MLLDNLGYAKFKSGRVDGLPDDFYRSLRIRDSLGLKMTMIANQIHLSEYYASKRIRLKQYNLQKKHYRFLALLRN